MSLYKHQLDIITDDKKKAGIFIGTGGGKTLIALSLARGKTLIIAPKTQVQDEVWQRENLKHNLNKDLTVISKENFRRDAHLLPRFDTVIGEEAHTLLGITPNICLRNNKPIPKTSQLFEALDTFLQRTKPDRIYLCTATIIKNPMTVWGAAKLLGYNYDFYKWRKIFYFRLKIRSKLLLAFKRRRIKVFIVKNDIETKIKLASIVNKIGYTGRIEDYVDMPEQVFRTIYVKLTDKQKRRIKELPMEYPDPLVLGGKTHCVENGCLLGDEFNKTELFKNEKLEKLSELAIEFPRLIIFAKYKAQIAQIEAMMRLEGRKVLTLTGDTKERGKVILEANNSLECIFIAQSQLSMGYELPDYPTMVFASLDWSLVSYVQALGRISRINNPKRNLYIHLIAKGKTIDEKVYKRVVINKMDFHLQMYE